MVMTTIGARAALSLTSGAMLFACLASGCAANKEAVIPQSGPTMTQIYRQHMAALAQGSAAQARERLPMHPPEEQTLSEYTRTSINEVDNRFGRLPNPDLVMYVFPHLAGNGRYPVPGYSTVFPMYESVEYALPGETASTRHGAPLAQHPR